MTKYISRSSPLRRLHPPSPSLSTPPQSLSELSIGIMSSARWSSLLRRSSQANYPLRTKWSQVPKRLNSIASNATKAGSNSQPRWTTTRALMLSGLTGACVYSFATWKYDPRRTATTSSTELPEIMPAYGGPKDMQNVCNSALCIRH